MADVKFSQFTDGDQVKVGDIVVGLRGGVNFKFDFPDVGFKDANGNYLLQYATAGAAAVNYPLLTNSLTTAKVIYGAAGTDADIGITIDPKGTGEVNIPANVIGVTQLNVDNLRLDGNAITSTDVNGDITITPNGTGDVVLDGLNWPQADGAANTLLKTNGAGQLSFTTATFPGTAGAAGTFLRSDGTNWIASTATLADTYAVSTILYASASNVVTGLATANRAVLTTNATGVPVMTALATDGQVIVGSTAGAPAAATLTPGTGISIANGSNTITISATGGGFGVATVAGTSQSAAVNTMYILLNAGQTTVTLPGTCSVGDTVILVGSTANAGGWILDAPVGDTVTYNGVSTSAGGTITSSALAGQTVEVVCDVADQSWVVVDTVSTLLTTA